MIHLLYHGKNGNGRVLQCGELRVMIRYVVICSVQKQQPANPDQSGDGTLRWYRRSSSPSEMEDSGRRKGRVRVCQAENFRSATLPTSLFLSAPHCSPPRHAEETSTTSISWRTESPSSATFRLTAMPVELKASSEVTAPAGRLLYCTQTQPSPSNTAECIGRSCHVFGVISSYQ